LRHRAALAGAGRARHLVVMSATPPTIADPAAACAVYFDGACPVCSREIALYQRMTDGRPDRPEFVDVTRVDEASLPGISREAALARFHVRTAEGEVLSGAAAFLALWRATPRLRLIARMLSVPPLPWLLEGAYRGFLRARPLWRRSAPAAGS
jgi:predicted DCC family thiol-disulfide oxidoreductase YuxK